MPPLPAPPELVAAYLLELAEERERSVVTIRLHKAALAAIHRSTGHEDPTTHEGVKRVMGDIARSKGRAQRQAKPLTAEALAAEALAAERATGHPAPGAEQESTRNPRQGPQAPPETTGSRTGLRPAGYSSYCQPAPIRAALGRFPSAGSS